MPRHHQSRSAVGVELDIDAVVAALDTETEIDWMQVGEPAPIVSSGTIHPSMRHGCACMQPGNWIARTLEGTEEFALWLQEDDRSFDVVVSEEKLVVSTFVRGGSYFTHKKDTALLGSARLRRPRLARPLEASRIYVKSRPTTRKDREIVLAFDESTRRCLERDSWALAETYGEAGNPQSLQVVIGMVATSVEAQEFIADITDIVPAAVTLSESRVIEVR